MNHSAALVTFAVACFTFGYIQAQTCTSDSNCGSDQCCKRPPFSNLNVPGTCQALSQAGERCPAGFNFGAYCPCDANSVCIVPNYGFPPEYGTCTPKPELLPGNRCYTDRNCDFSDCCVINSKPVLGLKGVSDSPDGTCMRRGQPGDVCRQLVNGVDRHDGVCPCGRFAACTNVGIGGTGSCVFFAPR